MRPPRAAAALVATLVATLATTAAAWPPSIVACARSEGICLSFGPGLPARLAIASEEGSVVVATWRDGLIDWGGDRQDAARFAAIETHEADLVICPPGIETPLDPSCRRALPARAAELTWRGWWRPAGERQLSAACPSIGTIRSASVEVDAVLLPMSEPGRDGTACAIERFEVRIAPLRP